MKVRRIEEHSIGHGGRLGRHVELDPRSRAFAVPAAADTITKVRHRRYGILDQGDLGSCTGNAITGCLNTLPLHITGTHLKTEADAVRLYSEATRLDSFQGAYPPEDTGSSGLAACKAAKNEGLISGYRHAFSVEAALTALMSGPVITGVNWYECLCDDQRVLTSDLRWVPIQDVEIGDELVGFDECIGQSARMRRTTVTNLGLKDRDAFEIVTNEGSVAVSGGHLLVKCDPKLGQSWIRADEIQPGDRLAYYMHPYDDDRSWEAGWLAGFFDGEGTVAGDYQVNFAQAVGPTLDRAVELLRDKGFEASPKQKRYPGEDARGIVSVKEVHNVYVTGPYHGALQMLGQIRPARLLDNCSHLWEGRSPKSRRCPPVTVQAVFPLGIERVHTIATSTGTLLVEGFMSHNSFDVPDDQGRVHIAGQVRGGHEFEIIGLQPAASGWLDGWIIAVNSWGLDWGVSGRFRFTVMDWARLLDMDGDCTIPVPASE